MAHDREIGSCHTCACMLSCFFGSSPRSSSRSRSDSGKAVPFTMSCALLLHYMLGTTFPKLTPSEASW